MKIFFVLILCLYFVCSLITVSAQEAIFEKAAKKDYEAWKIDHGNNKIIGPFTAHFQQYIINEHEKDYKEYFQVGKNPLLSYGGKQDPEHKVLIVIKYHPFFLIKNRPIVFIHGIYDRALGISATGAPITGWSANIKYFLDNGYDPAELYAISYDETKAAQNEIKCNVLVNLRRLVQAVLKYTESEQVDIIAHGKGVTYARLITTDAFDSVLSEQANSDSTLNDAEKERCGKLGDYSLKGKVNTLVGIAGMNHGICACLDEPLNKSTICDRKFGFWSQIECEVDGEMVPANKSECPTGEYRSQYDPSAEMMSCELKKSEVLEKLDNVQKDESADYIVSFWSGDDGIVNYYTWGRFTNWIKYTDHRYTFMGQNQKYGHYELKWKTLRAQLDAIKRGEKAKREKEMQK